MQYSAVALACDSIILRNFWEWRLISRSVTIVFLTVRLYGAGNPLTGGVTTWGATTAHVVPQAYA
jgi:hypothetical protein